MRPYETMVIFDPDVEETQIQGVLDRALDVVRAGGGNPGTINRWGRRPLAYEMNHKREGYYVVAEFTAEPKASAELDRFLVLADEVMRHKIIRLPDKVAGRSRPAGAPVPKAARPSTGSRPAAGPRASSARSASGPRSSSGSRAPAPEPANGAG